MASRILGFRLLIRAFCGTIFFLSDEEKGRHCFFIFTIIREAPMFQFALEGALFTLKAKSPALAPLFTLPPRMSHQSKAPSQSL